MRDAHNLDILDIAASLDTVYEDIKALSERFLGVKVQTGEHSSVQDSQVIKVLVKLLYRMFISYLLRRR